MNSAFIDSPLFNSPLTYKCYNKLKEQMRGQNKKEKSQCNQKLPLEETFTQKIEILGQSFINQNTFMVEQAPNRVNHENLELRENYFVVEGDNLIRVTELQVEDKIIKIRDSFSGASNLTYNTTMISQTITHPPNQETNPLSKNKEPSTQSDSNDSMSENGENKVKNIINLFLKWSRKERRQQEDLNKSLQNMILHHKLYNKVLLMKMSKEEKLRKAFLAFSQNQAKTMIRESNMENIKAHLKTLRKWRKICRNQNRKEQTHIISSGLERVNN